LVTLEANNSHLSVTGAGSQSKIALQNKEEFPTLPTVEGGEEFSLPAKALSDGIQSVAYCASTSAIKPELSSVYIHPDGTALITAATDSFRLAEKKVPLKKPTSTNPFLIPARSVSDILKFLETGTDDIQIASNDHQLSLNTSNAYITLRLTAGTFPDYTQIIPKTYITEATMLRFDFEHVLRRAAVFADQFNQTTLTIVPKKKQCTIHTQHASVGETTDMLTAALTGEEISIKFNQRYLLDALHPIATDSIVLQCSGQAQPAVIRPVGDTTFLYLVMPMNR
jgi:DNA polymerase-3 subunit beta